MKKLSKSDFDAFAEEFDRTRQKPWSEACEFLDSLDAGSLVLDIGAGGGRHSIYASKRHRVVALDISREMVGLLKKGGIPCVVADAKNIPFACGAFDAVAYVAAIHHIEAEEGRIQSLGEIHRILNRGGRFIASAWAREQEKFAKLADKNGDLQYTWDKKHPRFYHLFCEGELLRIAKCVGFTKLNEWRSGDNWWVEGNK